MRQPGIGMSIVVDEGSSFCVDTRDKATVSAMAIVHQRGSAIVQAMPGSDEKAAEGARTCIVDLACRNAHCKGARRCAEFRARAVRRALRQAAQGSGGLQSPLVHLPVAQAVGPEVIAGPLLVALPVPLFQEPQGVIRIDTMLLQRNCIQCQRTVSACVAEPNADPPSSLCIEHSETRGELMGLLPAATASLL